MKTVSIFRQVALFADASPIAANPTTIKALMELFVDRSFLPGVMQELVAGPLTVTVSPLPGPIGQRLSLDESGTGYHIDFGSQRIDIEQRAKDLDAANMGTTADFIRTATDFGRRIMTRFELVATRLAIVRRNLALDVSDKHLIEIYSRLFKPTPFFADNPPYEWIWQSVAKLPIPEYQKSEEANLITKLVRSQARIADKPDVTVLQIEYDVNTLPARSQPRFYANSLEVLLPKLAEFHDRLETDLMTTIS
jgi:hypothetical protein